MGSHWKGCALVNPCCPDDLCVLDPAEHNTLHLLGTMHMETRIRCSKKTRLFMAPAGTAETALIRRGSIRAREIWPDRFGAGIR